MKWPKTLLRMVKSDLFNHSLLINVRNRTYETVYNLDLERPFHIGSNVKFRTMPRFSYSFSAKSGLFISNDVFIDLVSSISIGEHVEISFGVKIIRHEHDIRNHSSCNSKISTHDLIIEDEVVVGCNSIILPKVERIGYGAIIGAGSVVTKNVKTLEIVAGNPVRKIGKRELE